MPLSTAARSVRILRVSDLIIERKEVRALGRARRIRVLFANTDHPDWHVIQEQLNGVQVALSSPDPRAPLPPHLRHAFWNVDDSIYAELTPATHGSYIASRALSTGDPELIEYATSTVAPADWRISARMRGLTVEQRALAKRMSQ